jgi:Protein of unknown function (DUF1488)
MALTRGSIVGYDTDRMMFEFTMMTRDARVLTCEISSVAMDHLDHRRGTLPQEREAQFVRLRDGIEKIASDIFNEKALEAAVVRIFVKHLPD